MLDFSVELLPLVQALMPGFLMTMTFYWFAEVPKPSQFERTLQALVATSIILIVVDSIQSILYVVGSKYGSFGPWSSLAGTGLSLAIGFITGMALAYFCNNDTIFGWARRRGFTGKTSTEDKIKIYQELGKSVVCLHMNDERRLMGRLITYPNDKQTGSFLLTEPSWTHGSKIVECKGTFAILISATDVQWVEFLEDANE